MESVSCGRGVGMIVDVRGSEGDGVGRGMVTFGLMVWGVEIGGSAWTISERTCSERTYSD